MQTSELQFLASLYSTNEHSDTERPTFLHIILQLVGNNSVIMVDCQLQYSAVVVASDNRLAKSAGHSNIGSIILYIDY